mmetsp:Transcript_6487/g.20387  ORF Transcript_6487/g.20387 Transcript_6487/m.20387 type:complete len:223 (+) Transcript_6487:839-1507(+)
MSKCLRLPRTAWSPFESTSHSPRDGSPPRRKVRRPRTSDWLCSWRHRPGSRPPRLCTSPRPTSRPIFRSTRPSCRSHSVECSSKSPLQIPPRWHLAGPRPSFPGPCPRSKRMLFACSPGKRRVQSLTASPSSVLPHLTHNAAPGCADPRQFRSRVRTQSHRWWRWSASGWCALQAPARRCRAESRQDARQRCWLGRLPHRRSSAKPPSRIRTWLPAESSAGP